MKFAVYGPFAVARDGKLINTARDAKAAFWKAVEKTAPGLTNACGCYVFAVRGRRGTLPWYVGLTTKRTFAQEVFGAHQVNHYDKVIVDKPHGRPQLYLLAKQTPRGRYAKPSGNSHRDIEFVEIFLFGIGLARNPLLRNDKNTKYLKNVCLPGVLNSPHRRPTRPESSFKATLGL